MAKKIIVYGKGNLGKLAEEILTRLKIKYEVRDREDIDKYPVKVRSKLKVLVCVATTSYTVLRRSLIAIGFTNVQHFYHFLMDYPEVGINNGWSWPKSLCKPMPIKFKGIDKQHFEQFIEWRVFGRDDKMTPTNDRYVIPEILAINPHYETIVSKMSEHIAGSTLSDIISRRHEKYGLWIHKNKHLIYVIFHAEGTELERLWINMPYISKERPILAVTVYHSIDGMYNIPALLHCELKDYQFHFRLHAFAGQNAVLYAIPKERIKSGK